MTCLVRVSDPGFPENGPPVSHDHRIVVPGFSRDRIREDPSSRKKGMFFLGLKRLPWRDKKRHLTHSGLRFHFFRDIPDNRSPYEHRSPLPVNAPIRGRSARLSGVPPRRRTAAGSGGDHATRIFTNPITRKPWNDDTGSLRSEENDTHLLGREGIRRTGLKGQVLDPVHRVPVDDPVIEGIAQSALQMNENVVDAIAYG